MRRRVMALLAAGSVALAGCSAPGPPKVTFFADGESTTAAPLRYCDPKLQSCEQGGRPATLKARPGEPVQVSLPQEVSETPWLVNVQYLDAKGRPQPVRQEVFKSDTQHAYTATPPSPGAQLLVVEIQQFGTAALIDENGQLRRLMRGVWSLQIQPGFD